MKSKITKIQIEMEGRPTLYFTMDEARDLYQTLSELFKKDTIHIPVYPDPPKKYPDPYPSGPWVRDSGNPIEITYFTSDGSTYRSNSFNLDSESPL